MAWSILSALAGLIGFFFYRPMFWVAGGISFVFFLIYISVKSYKKDQIEYAIFIIQNPENYSGLKRKKIINVISRIITYGLFFFVTYLIFGWYAFLWTGIAFGLFYIPELIHFFKTGELRPM